MEQADLFAPPPCPRHGAANVCEFCPEQYETDGYGFVHPSLARGRSALRECADCRTLVTRMHWHTGGTCVTCAFNRAERARAIRLGLR